MTCRIKYLRLDRSTLFLSRSFTNTRGIFLTPIVKQQNFVKTENLVNFLKNQQLMKKNISTSNLLMDKSEVKLSKKDQLKNAVKDYGSTVIVFHITISLASLGFFYLVVSSGIDMQQILNYVGLNFKFAENAGTFVTAYAIHKLFAPVRISITLGATPFIVRYLRNKGILKKN